MPFKVFVAGEEATAADINTYLAGQTVPRFTNSAQRTGQLSSPVLNQLSMLDSRPGITSYWNGSAWLDLVPFTQAGVSNTTVSGAQSAVIPFPVAFGTVTAVVASVINPGFVMSVDYPPTVTGFTCKAYDTNGGAIAGGMAVYWIAWGTRP